MLDDILADVAGLRNACAEQEYGVSLDVAEPEKGPGWIEHKARSQSLQEAVRTALGWDYRADLAGCSIKLLLERSSDGLHIRPFSSCRRRWCPVCAWRKSQRQWGMLAERLPALIEQNGPVRWLLLTLTVRNCPREALKDATSQLLAGFRSLSQPRTKLGRMWPATAWLRALEITFPRAGEAHPHLHVLMAVKPSYFKRGYVKQSEWSARWQQAAKLDYEPVVDVRRVKPLNIPGAEALGEALGGIREVSKYVTKASDLDADPSAIRAIASLKGTRFIDGGGWLRGVLRDDDDEQMELPEVEAVTSFMWRAAERTYRRKLEDLEDG